MLRGYRRKRRRSSAGSGYVAKRKRKFRGSPFRNTYRTKRKRYGYKGRKSGVVSYVSGGASEHNIILNNPVALTGSDAPIALINYFNFYEDADAYDHTLSYSVTGNHFPNIFVSMLDNDIFDKYKSLYRYASISKITAYYRPAVTQGQILNAGEESLQAAIIGVMCVDVTHDIDTYVQNYPLTVEGQKAAVNRRSSIERSIYKPWKYSFVPTYKPSKDVSNPTKNLYWKTKKAPWFDLDDYSTPFNYAGLGLIMRMRVPTVAGVEVSSTAGYINDEWPSIGYNAIIGRIQYKCSVKFSVPRF